MECSECRSKPGSPVLCAACIHNRRVVYDLQAEGRRLRGILMTVADSLPPGYDRENGKHIENAEDPELQEVVRLLAEFQL